MGVPTIRQVRLLSERPLSMTNNSNGAVDGLILNGELEKPDDFFICSQRSSQISPSGIYKRFKRYCPNHRLHDARHTNATALYEATKSLRLVQKQLGHSSLTTTQVYADVSPEQAVEGMNAMEKVVKSGAKKSPTPASVFRSE